MNNVIRGDGNSGNPKQRLSISEILSHKSQSSRLPSLNQKKPEPSKTTSISSILKRKNVTYRPNVNKTHITSNPGSPEQCKYSISQLGDLISQSCNPINVKILADMKPEVLATEKLTNLEGIFQLITQPGCLTSLSYSVINDLKDMIEINIFHLIPDISCFIMNGEQIPLIFITNWIEIQAVHRIMIYLLHSLDRNSIIEWIRTNFLERLVDLLDSPDQNEQSSIESVLNYLLDEYPMCCSRLFAVFQKKVQYHLVGLIQYVSIPPAIRFFIRYFSSNSLEWNVSYTRFFRSHIYPLVSTPFITESYQPLVQLSSLFLTKDPSNVRWSILYLLSHWPKSNTSKEVAFLHQLSILVPAASSTQEDFLLMRLLNQIVISIESNNFKVASTALKVVSDQQFLAQLAPIIRFMVPALSKSARIAQNHWNTDVQTLAANFSTLMSSIELRVRIAPDNNHKGQNRINNWHTIISTAEENDNSLKPDTIFAQIGQCL